MSLVSRGDITHVSFSISGDDETNHDSVVEITNGQLLHGNQPYDGGVYDAHMGTFDFSYKCATCDMNKQQCLGHEGRLTLNYPIYNPIYIQDTIKWLKLICFRCGQPVIERAILEKYPKSSRLDQAVKSTKTEMKKCPNPNCGAIHPHIKKNPKEPNIIIAETRVDKKITDSYSLYPGVIKTIFDRVSNETVEFMGRLCASHPRKEILTRIRVPSVSIRPDTRRQGATKSTSDGLTLLIRNLVQENGTMEITDKTLKAAQEEMIIKYNALYHSLLLSSGDDASSSIKGRICGKKGRIRNNLLGKRVFGVARSTIVNNPRVHPRDIVIPRAFAKIIQIKEVVQSYNREKLIGYVINGKKGYPGASAIIKGRNEYDIAVVKSTELNNGDIVKRDLITGDVVDFNRQPSLMISNTTTHRVVVGDTGILAILMNVMTCPFYAADFDGDQMNVFCSDNLAARNECTILSSVSEHLVSHKNGTPLIGQKDDSIIGTAELTRDGRAFDRFHYALLFATSTLCPELHENTYTGRDAISEILRDTPITFRAKAQFFNERFAAWYQYKTSETDVKIVAGRHETGVLDKKTIGIGGSLYRAILAEHSPAKVLDVMYNIQQAAIAFIMQRGFSIGIHDVMLPLEAKQNIDRVIGEIIAKSNLNTQQLNASTLVPSVGTTTEEYYESNQIEILKTPDDFTEYVMRSINPENNLLKLVMFGSKGSFENMLNMVCATGQKVINGERIHAKYGGKRTLPYFRSFETTPESRGYIANSYLAGMTSTEYIFNAMAARFDLIMKALVTTTTGSQNRQSIKCLECILANNFRMASKNTRIIQFAYGEDFQDPTKAVKVKFPTAAISTAEFERVYSHKDFSAYFEALKVDREKYRALYLRLQDFSYKDAADDIRRTCVDVSSIANSEIHAELSAGFKPEQVKDVVAAIARFCDEVPYILVNDIQRDKHAQISDTIREAAWLVAALCRAIMYPGWVIAKKITLARIKYILTAIKLRYLYSLVDPGTAIGILAAQSFSEQLTQYMMEAHQRSATGGSSKSIVNMVGYIFGARGEDHAIAPRVFCMIADKKIQTDRRAVTVLAKQLEMLRVSQFVTEYQIFFEQFGASVHPRYKQENAQINEFAKESGLPKPADLASWCIRFAIDKLMLVLKNISVHHIAMRLREIYPDIYVCHSKDTDAQIIMRIYVRASYFRGKITLETMAGLKGTILETIVRGVRKIITANPAKLVRTEIGADGAFARVDGAFYIETNGANLAEILTYGFVDKFRTHSSVVAEMARLFGIEAARMKIIYELRNIGLEIEELRHYLLYADEMTFTGKVTSIEAGGVKQREANNTLLRTGFSAPIDVLRNAAINGASDRVTGVTAPLLLGATPKLGTIYNSFHVNEEFVRKNKKSTTSLLEELDILAEEPVSPAQTKDEKK